MLFNHKCSTNVEGFMYENEWITDLPLMSWLRMCGQHQEIEGFTPAFGYSTLLGRIRTKSENDGLAHLPLHMD